MWLYASRGFSLVEALIAAALIAAAVVGLAHLVTVGATQELRSRQSVTALMLAQAKLEELRGFAWHFRADGTRVSSPKLETSPPWSLLQDREGYVERLDRFGAPTADTPQYSRRWAVAPLVVADPDTVALQVCVFGSDRPANFAEACVWALRTRKP